jgi:hypothetical protein
MSVHTHFFEYTHFNTLVLTHTHICIVLVLSILNHNHTHLIGVLRYPLIMKKRSIWVLGARPRPFTHARSDDGSVLMMHMDFKTLTAGWTADPLIEDT